MTNEKKQPPRHQPKFTMAKDVDAVYANIVRIAHTPSEMMFDFARLLPGDRGAKVVSRVIMSPLGAKLLHRALTENLAKYEAAFGEIVIPQKQTLADALFRGATPPENPDAPEDEGEGEEE